MSKQLTPKEYDAIKAGLNDGTDRNSLAARYKRSQETVVRIAKSKDWEDYHRSQRIATGRFIERPDGTLVRRDQVFAYQPVLDVDADEAAEEDEPEVVRMLRQEQAAVNAQFEAIIATILRSHG